MNVCILFDLNQYLYLYDIVQNSIRHSLYESPTQVVPRLKRTDTFSSRKISPNIERQCTRESKLIFFLSFRNFL
jgi:hypothetical protein